MPVVILVANGKTELPEKLKVETTARLGVKGAALTLVSGVL